MTTLETLLELAKTDEGRMRIRVMVAELVGFRFKNQSRSPDCPKWGEPVPNYTGSLDAMHEAEETLNNDNTVTYQQNLMMTWTGARTCDFTLYPADCIWHAKAIQRAIAFILTKQ